MAVELWSYIVDPDGEIKVAHVFYGRTSKDAHTWREHHLANCEYFQAAVNEGREIQKVENIPDSDLPVAVDEGADGEEGT